MKGLGFLSREGLSLERYGSEARSVSADGTTVVGYSNSAGGEEAFRWTRAGGMVGLGDLAGGEFKSAAWGVSADGSVVVGVATTDRGEEAFVWDSARGMRALKDELGGDLTGWRLLAARRVSDDGGVVVGEGIHDGRGMEAWRAVLAASPPPEGKFIRSDVDADGMVDISDAIILLEYLFLTSQALPFLDGGDANDDGRLDIGDAVYSLSFQFLGQPPPPRPFPGCGTDPSIDALSCASSPACA
jgi:probable HAF family extracellular repeat protein